jgi:hypothetical protein
MRSSGDFIEKFLGRRATTCLGWVLLFATLALLAALIVPRFLSKDSGEKAGTETKR